MGVFFHYGQCLYRKLVDCGFKTQYANDPILRKWFKSFVALALMPRDLDTLAIHFFDNHQPDGYDLSNFCDYFAENWLDTGFHKDIWNHADHNNERTNNNVEGYNLRFSNYFSVHPTIWKLIICLIREESCVNLDFIA